MELSPFLNSLDSLAEKQGFTNSFEFETNFDRDTITTSKILNGAVTNAKIGTASIGTANIGTLSFNQISGGTAILGGTTNGNGLLSLKNSAGSEIVKLYNNGMAVDNGSLTIKNSGGSVVLDGSGIVGTSNFSFGTIAGGPGLAHTFTSTSFEDVPNSSISIILNRASPVAFWSVTALALQDASGTQTNLDSGVFSAITIGGTNVSPNMGKRGRHTIFGSDYNTDGFQYVFCSTHTVQTLPAGTTTVKLQRKINNTAGTITGLMDEFLLTYLVLGK